MDNDNNVFSMIAGGKPEKTEDEDNGLPTNSYVIEDIVGNEHYADGFLVFTSQHIAVMQDRGKGAIPVLVLPLDQVRVAEIVNDEVEDEEAPF